MLTERPRTNVERAGRRAATAAVSSEPSALIPAMAAAAGATTLGGPGPAAGRRAFARIPLRVSAVGTAAPVLNSNRSQEGGVLLQPRGQAGAALCHPARGLGTLGPLAEASGGAVPRWRVSPPWPSRTGCARTTAHPPGAPGRPAEDIAAAAGPGPAGKGVDAAFQQRGRGCGRVRCPRRACLSCLIRPSSGVLLAEGLEVPLCGCQPREETPSWAGSPQGHPWTCQLRFC